MYEEQSGDFIQQLRSFYFVARTGSFSGAAREMHRNQSTLSYQIGRLEDNLGVQLFKRTGRGAVLTPQGQQLFSSVVDIFTKIDSLRTVLAPERVVHPSGPVRFATSPVATFGILPPLMRELCKSLPHIQFSIRQFHSKHDELHHALTCHELDFAILPSDTPMPDMRFTPFYKSETALCIPENMAVPALPINIHSLAGLPHIVSKTERGLRGCLESLIQKHGESFNIVHEVEDLFLQATMVSAGLGVAVMDTQTLRTLAIGLKVRIIPLADNIFPARQYGIIYPFEEPAPQARAVMDFLIQHGNI